MGEMEEEEFEQQRQQNSNAAQSSNFEVTGASGNNIASRKHSPGMDSLQHAKTPCRKVSPTVSFGPQTITAASSIKGSPILSSRTTKRSTVDVLHRFAQDLCAVNSSGRRAKFHNFLWVKKDGNGILWTGILVSLERASHCPFPVVLLQPTTLNIIITTNI
uniref:Uncharacterized protein n=1 Tax=Meloidogyne enterolobii TaxID=390850 RepID=A0A6V7W9H5_MELEN|nr:unnamed protein product [Meloidogyne enterolobii]